MADTITISDRIRKLEQQRDTLTENHKKLSDLIAWLDTNENNAHELLIELNGVTVSGLRMPKDEAKVTLTAMLNRTQQRLDAATAKLAAVQGALG